MSAHRAQGRNRSDATGERKWRLLAAAVVVGALALLAAFGGLGYGLSGLGDAAASAGHSLADSVRAPGRGSPTGLQPRGRDTPAYAVIFYGGYFCATGPYGRRVRLVWALRELETLREGSSSVVGPFHSKAEARGAC